MYRVLRPLDRWMCLVQTRSASKVHAHSAHGPATLQVNDSPGAPPALMLPTASLRVCQAFRDAVRMP